MFCFVLDFFGFLFCFVFLLFFVFVFVCLFFVCFVLFCFVFALLIMKGNDYYTPSIRCRKSVGVCVHGGTICLWAV